MKKAYEYFSNKHVKNQPSDRKHHPTTDTSKPSSNHNIISKKELKDASQSLSAHVSVPNSLKNSKGNNHHASNQPELLKQSSLQNQQQPIQLPDPNESNTKMSRVRSYGNLSSKNNQKNKLISGQVPSKQQHQVAQAMAGNYFYLNDNMNNQSQASLVQDQLSQEEAASLLMKYSKNFKNASPEIKGSQKSVRGEMNNHQQQQQHQSSPKFLQINLKMFNNYLTSNNPQNINNSNQYVPSANKFNTGDQKSYNEDEQLTPQIIQLLQQHHNSFNVVNNSSKERIRKARDPLSKMIADNDTLNLISQVSKKSIELQQQLDRKQINISADVIASLNKQGLISKNLQKMKAYNGLHNQYEEHYTINKNPHTYSSSSINTQAQTASQTIQQSSGEKKRPQSEISNNLYNKCQQTISNQRSQNKLTPLHLERPTTSVAINGFSNINSAINTNMMNLNRHQSQSSCSLLKEAGVKAMSSQQQYIDDSSILDEISPNQKNHIQVLVAMLNEKNKYIRQLHKKVDKLNDIINNFQHGGNISSRGKALLQNRSKTKLSPSNMSKSRSQQNMLRAKSAQQIGYSQRSKSKQKRTVLAKVGEYSDMPQVSSINEGFDKVMANLDEMKRRNLEVFREIFLNDSSFYEDTSLEDYDKSHDASRQNIEAVQQSQLVEECNYVSIGGGAANISHLEDDSYSDYLNNADLNLNEESKQQISAEKRKIIKSTSNNKVKKSTSQSKCASVRPGSQKMTARGNGVQSQLHNQLPSNTPILQSQKSQKQQPIISSLQKSNIPTYRPPTTQALASKSKKTIQVAATTHHNSVRGKKPSISSACENYNHGNNSNFVSITSVGHHQDKIINGGVQSSHLIDQINNYKQMMRVKDKKLEKHKEFINKLKVSLQSVLVEHKKQAEQLENQKKELRALKCKLSLY